MIHILIEPNNPLYYDLKVFWDEWQKTKAQIKALKEKHGWKEVYTGSFLLSGVDYVSFGIFFPSPPPALIEGYKKAPKRTGLAFAYSPKKGTEAAKDIDAIKPVKVSDLAEVLGYESFFKGFKCIMCPDIVFDFEREKIVLSINEEDPYRPKGEWTEVSNIFLRELKDL